MNWIAVAFAAALSGFHVAITLLALYRAQRALMVAREEGRANSRTLIRIATVRFVAVIVILTGGLLASSTPMLFFSPWLSTFLPASQHAAITLIAWAWLVWVPSTILLDNLALRWWKQRSR